MKFPTYYDFTPTTGVNKCKCSFISEGSRVYLKISPISTSFSHIVSTKRVKGKCPLLLCWQLLCNKVARSLLVFEPTTQASERVWEHNSAVFSVCHTISVNRILQTFESKVKDAGLTGESFFPFLRRRRSFSSQYSHAYLGAELAGVENIDLVCECFILWPYIIDGPFISAILRSRLPRQEYSCVSSIKMPRIPI